jgi:stage V sporulation protein R
MGGFRFRTSLPGYLRDEQQKIEGYARGYGLDFFPVLFESLSYDQMNEIASYGGFPTRYPHWRFGMEYERIAKSYEYGLSKIYELVINNHPAVAYLLEGNSLVDQKLVMAHVYGHVDFFKNNFAFQITNQGRDPVTQQPARKWIDTMANHASTARRWAARHGIDKIEEFLDVCFTLENLIDPHKPFAPPKARRFDVGEEEERSDVRDVSRLRVEHDYMESFINPEEFLDAQREQIKREQERARKFPEQQDRDVLGFLLAHAPLERWEHDLLGIIRTEAYYFVPQMQTKIMNEGWATYWHSRIMTEKALDASEVVDYADRCAGVLSGGQGRLNPYKLGLALFRHIEERWDRGQFGKAWEECDDWQARREWNLHAGLGRKKLFEVRALYNDVTFIDAFLTPDFVFEQKLFSFGFNPRNDRWEVVSRQFEEVKQALLFQLTNAGQPFIYVDDANFENRGELLLHHDHQGVDLRLDYARDVLQSLVRVWKRPVQIRTQLDGKTTALRFDGKEHSQKLL